MPRQQRSMGGGRAPSRPTVAPSRPAVAPQQTRPATTSAHPPATQQQHAAPPAPAPVQSQGPGLFGQMASTAAGVAVGSSIGHAIGGFFGGGGSAPAEAQAAPVQAQAAEASNGQSNSWGPRSCEVDAKQFTKCLDENQGNMQICGWYLEQLKACQSAASQY